jgi:hypothetical protein
MNAFIFREMAVERFWNRKCSAQGDTFLHGVAE